MSQNTPSKIQWASIVMLGAISLGTQPAKSQLTPEADQQYQEQRLAAIEADRQGVVGELAHRWAVLSGENVEALVVMFGRLSDPELLAIQDATDIHHVRRILISQPTNANLGTSVEPLILGALDRDFVYTPVAPCRVVDTRFGGGGVIPAGGTRSFDVHGNVAGQGGNPAGCPSPRGEPRAVHINVTVVPVGGSGFVKVYPFNTSEPNASLVNFTAGTNIANAATVQTCFLCGPDITVKVSQAAHVIIDTLGFYHEGDEIAESSTGFFFGTLVTEPSMTSMDSITINVPGPGQVIVRAMANIATLGGNTEFRFGIGTNTTSINGTSVLGGARSNDTIRRTYPVADEEVFNVISAGPVTYYANAQRTFNFQAQNVIADEVRMTAVFVP